MIEGNQAKKDTRKRPMNRKQTNGKDTALM